MQYVRPHLEYAIVAWCPWQQGDINLLENVQRKAVRMISGLNSHTYEDRLKELNMTTLTTRRNYLDLIQTYKILNRLDNVDSSTWFELLNNDQRVTRLRDDGCILARQTVSRSEIRANFYSQRVIGPWNALPADIRNANTLPSFKSKLLKYLKIDQDGAV